MSLEVNTTSRVFVEGRDGAAVEDRRGSRSVWAGGVSEGGGGPGGL